MDNDIIMRLAHLENLDGYRRGRADGYAALEGLRRLMAEEAFVPGLDGEKPLEAGQPGSGGVVILDVLNARIAAALSKLA